MQELEVLATQQAAIAGAAATGQLALIAQLQQQLAACQAALDTVQGREAVLDPAPNLEGGAVQHLAADPGDESGVHGGKRSAGGAGGAPLTRRNHSTGRAEARRGVIESSSGHH